MGIIERCIRWVLAGLLLMLAVPMLTRWVWQSRYRISYLADLDLAAVLIGIALGLGLLLWTKPKKLWTTLHHEACHALACMMLRVDIRAITISDGHGGSVLRNQSGPFRGTLITLAPYIISLTIMPLLLALPWLPPPWPRQLALGLLGLCVVQHYRSLISQISGNWRSKESDLYRAGWLLSCACIVSAQLALLGWLLHVIW